MYNEEATLKYSPFYSLYEKRAFACKRLCGAKLGANIVAGYHR